MREQTLPLQAADETFGVGLYRLLAEDAGSMVLSPESVAAVLRMALCGARGQTAAELAAALHTDSSPGAAADALRSVASVLDKLAESGSVTFRAPSTAWVQSGLALRPEFTAALGGAELAEADFFRAPEPARAEINRVIEEQTAGKITGLLPPGAVDANTRLVLASAVYLKAAWARPFPAHATRDEPFHAEGGSSVTVPMMHGTAPRDYVRGDGFQAVLLPYANAPLAMAVILPDGPLAGLRDRLTGPGLTGALAGAARHEVTLAMPRFRLEATFDLIPALVRLGVREAFGLQADFSGITGSEPLHISVIAHKAYIDVDEQGTEAAAATAAVFAAAAAMRPPPPVTMTVDRPFLFAIIETTAGLPLFLGQVTNPR